MRSASASATATAADASARSSRLASDGELGDEGVQHAPVVAGEIRAVVREHRVAGQLRGRGRVLGPLEHGLAGVGFDEPTVRGCRPQHRDRTQPEVVQELLHDARQRIVLGQQRTREPHERRGLAAARAASMARRAAAVTSALTTAATTRNTTSASTFWPSEIVHVWIGGVRYQLTRRKAAIAPAPATHAPPMAAMTTTTRR